MKRFRALATLCVAAFAIALSAPAAVADNGGVPQSSIIKTSPDTLYYENMLVGIPKSETLTIQNISDRKITISPRIDFGDEAGEFIDYSLLLCDPKAQCYTPDPDQYIQLQKGENARIDVSVTLKKQMKSEDVKQVSMTGNLVVEGIAEAEDGEVDQIIPADAEQKDNGFLASTGVSDLVLLIAISAFSLIAAGCFFVLSAKKRKHEAQVQ